MSLSVFVSVSVSVSLPAPVAADLRTHDGHMHCIPCGGIRFQGHVRVCHTNDAIAVHAMCVCASIRMGFLLCACVCAAIRENALRTFPPLP